MTFSKDDIERSKAYLQSLIERGILTVEADQLNAFVEFIAENIASDLSENNLIDIIQLYTHDEIRVLESDFFRDLDFELLLTKSFAVEKRKQLKEKLLQVEDEQKDELFDLAINKAFQIRKREELKNRFKSLEDESKDGATIKRIWPIFVKSLSIAASIIIVFLIWQPQKLSDTKLYSDYVSDINSATISDFTQTDLVAGNGGLRGDEEHFKNFTYHETIQLQEAISLIKQKRFALAREIFSRYDIRKEMNPGLTLYMAIAQLNSDELQNAIVNLEYLSDLPNFSFSDDAKFHLAFAYLKAGDRRKAKEVLRELATTNNKYFEDAKNILGKIRWF